MYRFLDVVIRAAEVAPKCLSRSHVKEKKYGSLKVALMWPKHGCKEEEKSRNGEAKRKEKENSDRGGGCLDLITRLSPSKGQVYFTAARLVPCNVQCIFLCNAICSVL